ncbi:MAG: acyl dehydratase [Steroidobacteraceae bacterium]
MEREGQVYHGPPSALRFMSWALRPRPEPDTARPFPQLRLAWLGFAIGTAERRALAASCGVEGASGDVVRVLFPHIFGFRLSMALLTHPHWPLPIWRALQVRNRLLLRGEPAAVIRGDLHVSVAGWRVLAKGVEVDLRTRLLDGTDCAWESIVTFYYRGRFDWRAAQDEPVESSRESPRVEMPGAAAVHWITGTSDRWRFARWTGDYNGLHQWDWYARRYGFPGAFSHPQRMAVQCVARLARPVRGAQELDLWLKGPVPYGAAVHLYAQPAAKADSLVFSLTTSDSVRPALIGAWHPLATSYPL